MQAEHYTQDYFEVLDSIVDTSTTRGKRVYNNSKDSHINWKKVHVEMIRLFPELTLSSEGLRSQYRRRHDISLKQNDKARHDKNRGRASLEERLIFELKRKRTLTELVDTLAEDEDAIMAGAARLQLEGYTGVRVWQEEGKIYLQNINKPLVGRETVDMSELYDGDVIQFAVVSDTHMGSTLRHYSHLRISTRMLYHEASRHSSTLAIYQRAITLIDQQALWTHIRLATRNS